MNGRFIFDSVDHRDKRVLQSILGSLPITAEPRLQAPLDRIFEVPHEKGQPMSRKDALDSLVYRVTSSDEYNPKSVYVKIFPDIMVSLQEIF